MNKFDKNVAILGASDNPDRYSNKALKLLLEKGYNVFPVHPVLSSIEGIKVFKSLLDIKEGISTLTVYVNKNIIEKEIGNIIILKPERVIFNPGTESSDVEKKLIENKIKVIRGCTLVLLSSNQF